MSTSEESKVVRLQVRAADSETEIFIIDGQFHLRDRGVGSLDTQLEPGIYKLKASTGGVTQEQHVVLRDKEVSLNLPPLAFASPAPLNETSKTHEYHMGAAERESRKIHLSAGSGSWIFVFARDLTSTRRAPVSWNPAMGLSLRDELGNLLADVNSTGTSDLSQDPWAACNVEVDPGTYRLRLELPPHQDDPKPVSLEQTIVASPGWQTQVFLLQRAYGPGLSDWRADLSGASILLSMGPGFDAARSDFRKTELARLGLTNRRQVVSQELRQMLRLNIENPMLGILAAHLLLLNQQSDTDLQTVITNLRNLLVMQHPDVEALALQFEPASAYLCQTPPMLQRSWSLIVDATATRPGLIPPGSLAAGIWDRLWGEEPWLIWNVPEVVAGAAVGAASPEDEAVPEVSEFEKLLESHLGLPPRRFGRPTRSPFTAVESMQFRSSNDVEPPEPGAFAAPLQAKDIGASLTTPPMDEERMRMLVRTLGIPEGNLRHLVNKVYAKMSGKGRTAENEGADTRNLIVPGAKESEG
ncbi:MAG: hypothetical protein ABSH01_17255 [Terriglobia bacterium]|jgi:hypothetical protein